MGVEASEEVIAYGAAPVAELSRLCEKVAVVFRVGDAKELLAALNALLKESFILALSNYLPLAVYDSDCFCAQGRVKGRGTRWAGRAIDLEIGVEAAISAL